MENRNWGRGGGSMCSHIYIGPFYTHKAFTRSIASGCRSLLVTYSLSRGVSISKGGVRVSKVRVDPGVRAAPPTDFPEDVGSVSWFIVPMEKDSSFPKFSNEKSPPIFFLIQGKSTLNTRGVIYRRQKGMPRPSRFLIADMTDSSNLQSAN
jgi:hypothetical protein